jgi:NADH-quinone oxidoreductase subunit M
LLDFLDSDILWMLVAWPVIAASAAGLLRRKTWVIPLATCVQILLAGWAALRYAMSADLDIQLEWVRVGMGADLSFEASACSLAAAGALAGLGLLGWLLWRPGDQGQAGYAAATGGMQAALTGAVLAGDFLLLAAMATLMIFSGMMLTALWGAQRASKIELRPFGAQYVGWLMLMTVVMRIGWLHYRSAGVLSFSLGDLLAFAPPPAEWDGLWLMLLAAVLGLFALGPLMWVFGKTESLLPSGPRLLWLCGTRVAGAVVIVRCVLPLWPGAALLPLPWAWVVLGSLAAAMLAGAVIARLRSVPWSQVVYQLAGLYETGWIALAIYLGPGAGPWILALAAAEVIVLALLQQRESHASTVEVPEGLRRRGSIVAAVAILGLTAALVGVCLIGGPLIHSRAPRLNSDNFLFFLHRSPDAGLLSVVGIALWAVGIFAMGPFARQNRPGSREVLARLWGGPVVHVGLAMFLLDGVRRDPNPTAAGYVRWAWMSDPLRIAVLTVVHALLVMALAGCTVALLRRRGRKLEHMDELTGLAAACPREAAGLMIAGLSLFGAAPLGGFWTLGILFGLRASWHSRALLGLPLLFVLPVLGMSVLDLAGRMYDRPQQLAREATGARGMAALLLKVAIVLAIVCLVILGIVPQLLLEPVGWLAGGR